MEAVDVGRGRADQRNALLAGFLGWTLDAFDFFLLAFVLVPIGQEFHVTTAAVAAAFGASLATRWLGALVFGLLADHFGRRLVTAPSGTLCTDCSDLTLMIECVEAVADAVENRAQALVRALQFLDERREQDRRDGNNRQKQL